ncbi:MAG: hypothetical protein ACYDEB_04845 [Dehalococcoidia bacterium]
MMQRTAVTQVTVDERTRLYAAFGCVIDSDLALPVLAAADGGLPCLRVRRAGNQPQAMTPAEHVFDLQDAAGDLVYRLERSRDHYVWRYPGVGEFQIARDGTEVLWDAPDASHNDAASALAGPLLGFALQLQGQTSLHGSAVVVEDRAVGLLAPSGFGKSTLAAALVARGCELVTDDVLALGTCGEAVVALPGPSGMKLWPDALDRVLRYPDWEALPRHASWLEKRVLRARPAACGAPARPIGALFVLAPSTPDIPIEVTRLRGRDALVAALSSGYNAHLLSLEPRLLAAQLDVLRVLVKAAPVYLLRYPRAFEHIAEVADAVVAWGRPDAEGRSQ